MATLFIEIILRSLPYRSLAVIPFEQRLDRPADDAGPAKNADENERKKRWREQRLRGADY